MSQHKWFIRNEPPGLQRYWRGSKFPHARMYTGRLVENITQAQARALISQYRAMHPQFIKLWEGA